MVTYTTSSGNWSQTPSRKTHTSTCKCGKTTVSTAYPVKINHCNHCGWQ